MLEKLVGEMLPASQAKKKKKTFPHEREVSGTG
jgi:hypothetical protein